MAKFTVTLRREVVSYDEVERVVEAENEDDARAKGAALASEFDDACPDDACETGAPDCQDWDVSDVEPADDDAVVDD